LVHVYAGPKIFEVSTFRSIANGTVGNEFGTMDEDAQRRDFTLNALYYDPIENVVVDYVGGFKDIEAKRIKPVIPLKSIFKEDPVRMIRCVKYASTTGFRIAFTTRLAVSRDAPLLAGASPSRLTEEFVKILGSGVSRTIIATLDKYKLLHHILPEPAALLSRSSSYRASLYADLSELDAIALSPAREKQLSVLLGFFLKSCLELRDGLIVDSPEAYQDALREARLFLAPLNLPRVELEAAVLFVFKKRGLSPSQKPRRTGSEADGDAPHKPRRRRRKGAAKSAGGAGGSESASSGGASAAPLSSSKGASPVSAPPPSKGSGGSQRREGSPSSSGSRNPAAEKATPRPAAGDKPAARSGGPSSNVSTPSDSEPGKRRRKRRRKPASKGPGAPEKGA
jgi:poly(A) polymerase